MPYGGNFLAVGVFSFLALTTLAEAIKPTYGGSMWAVMSYGGNCLAVGGFSFLGGNDFGGGGKTKILR